MPVSNEQFGLALIECVTNRSAVDFNHLAQLLNYKDANVASVRFGQIQKAILTKKFGSPTKSPVKRTPKSTPHRSKRIKLERELTPTPVEPRTERKAAAGSKRKLKEIIESQEKDDVDDKAGSTTEEDTDEYADEANGEQIFGPVQTPLKLEPDVSTVTGLSGTFPDLNVETDDDYDGAGDHGEDDE